MKKEVIIAVKNDNFQDVQQLPWFVPVHKYERVEGCINAEKREVGHIKTDEIEFKIQSFDPKALFELRCAWERKKKEEDHEFLQKDINPKTKCLFVNWVSSQVAQMAVSLLLQWVVERTDNTFPPNFKIWTGLYEGKDAIFCSFESDKDQ